MSRWHSLVNRNTLLHKRISHLVMWLVTAHFKANEGVFKSSRTCSMRKVVLFSATGCRSIAIFWASAVRAVAITFSFAPKHMFIALHLNPKYNPPFSNGRFEQIKYLHYLGSNSGKLNPQSRICTFGLLFIICTNKCTYMYYNIKLYYKCSYMFWCLRIIFRELSYCVC